MSICDRKKVDGMALNENCLRLLITDHLDWNDEYNHLLLLQQKINSYIVFCESGQYNQVYKDITVERTIFEIHFLFKPTLNAVKFLKQVQKQVIALGITIEYHIVRR